MSYFLDFQWNISGWLSKTRYCDLGPARVIFLIKMVPDLVEKSSEWYVGKFSWLCAQYDCPFNFIADFYLIDRRTTVTENILLNVSNKLVQFPSSRSLFSEAYNPITFSPLYDVFQLSKRNSAFLSALLSLVSHRDAFCFHFSPGILRTKWKYLLSQKNYLQTIAMKETKLRKIAYFCHNFSHIFLMSDLTSFSKYKTNIN